MTHADSCLGSLHNCDGRVRQLIVETSVALFTQRICIISGAVVRQFSANGDSHRAKHLRLKDKPLALRLLKWHDSSCHVDDISVSQVSPVSQNQQTVYNHMDALIMCSDWDIDPPNILDGDKVTFFALNYIVNNHLQLTGCCLTEVVFWGKVPWSLGREGWQSRWFIFITNTPWVKVCYWETKRRHAHYHYWFYKLNYM